MNRSDSLDVEVGSEKSDPATYSLRAFRETSHKRTYHPAPRRTHTLEVFVGFVFFGFTFEKDFFQNYDK